jgi:hypothetical protein
MAMALEMRGLCEKCGKALPPDSSDAYICSYECTWCGGCTAAMNRTCPNCGGELVKRPQRKKKA